MGERVNEEYLRWSEEALGPGSAFEKPEALAGIRVLDFTLVVLGPTLSGFLADFGAEVVRVELPGMGDRLGRSIAPWGRFWKNQGFSTLQEGRNKLFATIDVRKPEGQALFLRLAALSDVLVENFTPGTLDEWGIGYRQLQEINPRLVYLAASGFGQWGLNTRRPSFDPVAQGASGFSWITGFPDGPATKSGTWPGDYCTAALGAVAVLAALHARQRTGRGQYIELSQTETLMRMMDWTWTYQALTGKERGRTGNRDAAVAPAGAYRCRDGFVAVAATTDDAFRGLCRAMGVSELAEDSRFATIERRSRPDHAEALDRHVAEWVASKTRDEIVALAERHGFDAGPVLDFGEVCEDEHFRRRGAVQVFEDSLYGDVALPGPVPKLSRTPGRLRWAGRPVGFHNRYVFQKILGLTPAEIRALEEQGVIGSWVDRVGCKPPDDWEGQGTFF